MLAHLGEMLDQATAGEVVDLVKALGLSQAVKPGGWCNAVKLDDQRVVFRADLVFEHPSLGPLHICGDLSLVRQPQEK